MTRFEKEISGLLGAYWVESAKREVKRAVEQAEQMATVESDGAIKWNSNGHYLMDDFCEKLEYAGFNFSRIATAAKRQQQNAEFIESYKAHQRTTSSEEIAEMRAVFGKGTKVIDVISGATIQL